MKKKMNQLFVSPSNIFMLMIDVYVNLIVVGMYIWIQATVHLDGGKSGLLSANIFLTVAVCLAFLRETSQVIKTPLDVYIKDIMNIFDWLQILALVWSVTILWSNEDTIKTRGDESSLKLDQRLILTISAGISWLQLLNICVKFVFSISVSWNVSILTMSVHTVFE